MAVATVRPPALVLAAVRHRCRWHNGRRFRRLWNGHRLLGRLGGGGWLPRRLRGFRCCLEHHRHRLWFRGDELNRSTNDHKKRDQQGRVQRDRAYKSEVDRGAVTTGRQAGRPLPCQFNDWIPTRRGWSFSGPECHYVISSYHKAMLTGFCLFLKGADGDAVCAGIIHTSQRICACLVGHASTRGRSACGDRPDQ